MSALLSVLSACDKVDDLPYYTTGNAVVLTSSAATVAPAESDSAKPVLTYSWGDPKYAVDSAHTKFVLELDKVGNNFSYAVKHIVYGGSGTSFTGSEITKMLYNEYGVSFGSVTDFEARVTSSYANNNDSYVSNVVPVKLSPYAKLLSPTTGKLFIVGDATQGGWSNPVPANQEFTKIDDKHYTLTTNLYGKKEFLILPQNGSWDHKYSLADTTIERNKYISDGGDFGFDLAKNFPGPERDGKYKIDFDFNNGKFTVTQINALPAPAELFLVGGATPGGWSNPVPVPSQQFTKTADPNVFELTISLKANESYLFLPVNGDWGHKYGANNPPTPLKGTLYADGDVSGSNTPSPAVDGTYKITVDFSKGKFWLENR